jgi:SAM-dependent methyltransferase
MPIVYPSMRALPNLPRFDQARKGGTLSHREEKRYMGQSEIERIRTVYKKREAMRKHRYNPLDLGAFYLTTSRDRSLVQTLRLYLEQSALSLTELRILDIGCGTGDVLRRLVLWGARPTNLAGIDVLEESIQKAKMLSPNICFAIADAQNLPFQDETWDLVLLFMVISSVLNPDIQARIASEALRVLKPHGAILWYDFWTNPINPDTVGITPARVRELFPGCRLLLKRTTLVPPLARRLARISWTPCWMLESLPFLRTHYMGLIYKGREAH